MEIKDMPKLESPFVRKEINGNYIVTPEIAEGYEWVFNDDTVMAVEKLNGCLHYQTPILTDNGFIEVGLIVNRKLPVKVLSYNFNKKITEFKPISYYHKERNADGFVCVTAEQKYHGTRPRNLIVTPNHKFWTDEGWKRADKLKKGEIVYHLTKKLDFVRQQIILGTLLGDGSIYWGDGKKNCGFGGVHSIKQTKYVDLKIKLLGNLINECKGTKGGYTNSKPNRRFNSVINKHLSDFIKDRCVLNGKKIITKKWVEQLSPIAFAIWYMDDGNLIKGNGKQRYTAGLATNAYSVDEVKLLQSSLLRYGITSNIQNSKTSKGNRMLITTNGSDIFFNVIAPYVIPDMNYKLPVNLRRDSCYWDDYHTESETDLIPTKIINVTKQFKERRGNSNFQYDIEVKDNSNYFAGNILVHNTNVSVLIQDGVITSCWNRTERLPFFNKGKRYVIEGLLESNDRGYIDFLGDGQHFGELIGEKVNGNPYKIKGHVWIPLKHLQKKYYYKSWGKYSKDFNAISEWFKELMPLYALATGSGYETTAPDGVKTGKYNGFVEGIVFTHPDGRMAKLRRDMFDWYDGRRHKD